MALLTISSLRAEFFDVFLAQVGLLLPENTQSVNLAFSIYKSKATTSFIKAVGTTPAITLAEGFKRSFSMDVNVEFVGVWSVFDLPRPSDSLVAVD